jgi:hypothetical protein
MRDKAPLDLYLEAQRRLADSESRFFASLVDYALAIKNVHFEKGSLLENNDVFLAESPWPDKAYSDAAKRRISRWQGGINYKMKPGAVSADPIEQETGSPRRDEEPEQPQAESVPAPQPQPGSVPQGPSQQGSGRQGIPPQPNPPVPPQSPAARPANPGPDTSPLQTLPPTNRATEPPPSVWQQPDLRPRDENHISVPVFQPLESATTGGGPHSSNAPATGEPVSIMVPRRQDLDNLLPSPDRRGQTSATIAGFIPRNQAMATSQPSNAAQKAVPENSIRREGDKPQAAAEQPTRASYIQTIPIPWARNPQAKSSAAPISRSAVEVVAPADVAASLPKMPSPAPLQSSSQSPGQSSAHNTVLPIPVTTPDVGATVRQTIHTPSASEPAAPVQPPVQLIEQQPHANASPRHDPQVHSLPSLAEPAVDATGTNRLRNIERLPAIGEYEPSPLAGKVQPQPPTMVPRRSTTKETSIPSGILQTSGILESGAVTHADAISQPSAGIMPAYGIVLPAAVVHADAISQPERSMPAYGIAQPSGVIHADGGSQKSGGNIPAYGIAQPEVVVRASGVAQISGEPANGVSQSGSASQSSVAIRQSPPAGVLQSFPPVGRIQNLPPIGAVPMDTTSASTLAPASTPTRANQLNSTKTEPLPPTDTKPSPAENRMQSLPPIGGLQSLPPMGTSQPTAEPTKKSSPPGGGAQSSLPSGAIQSTAPVGVLQSFPPL